MEGVAEGADLLLVHLAKLRVADAVAVEEDTLRRRPRLRLEVLEHLHHHWLELRRRHDLRPLAHARSRHRGG